MVLDNSFFFRFVWIWWCNEEEVLHFQLICRLTREKLCILRVIGLQWDCGIASLICGLSTVQFGGRGRTDVTLQRLSALGAELDELSRN